MTSRLVTLLGSADPTGTTATALASGIRALILDGRLTLGERLPSERALAVELGRSRSTVTRAYDALFSDGYISRVHGGGTRVTLPHARTGPQNPQDAGAIDLSIASMDSTPGLYEATLRSLPRLAAARSTSGYEQQGLPELREAVAARFTTRGAPTHPDQIIVTSGAMSALNLVLSAFSRRGDTALVEQPSFPHALEALHRHGQRPVPTPVDTDGWDGRHLADALLRMRPRLAYLMPDFHNPTGASMPDAERRRLVAAARSAGTLLIVDETTAELDIDRPTAPAPMAAHDPAVITLGSMSKLAWGGLRLGWIRADRDIVRSILAVRPSFDLGTALLEQFIAVELLGDVDALARHVRARLRAGRDAVAAGLAAFEGIRMPEVHGGLSAWVDLAAPIATAFSLAARSHGVVLPSGSRFAIGGVLERFVRIPITLTPERAADALDRLHRAWTEVGSGAAPHDDRARVAAIV